MKLIYVNNSRLPTAKAHGHQIVKMCQEFARQGAQVTLLWPTRQNLLGADIFSFYNAEKNFIARQIKCFDFIRYDRYLKKAGYFLQGLSFLVALLFTRLDAEAIIYTRKPEIAWLFKCRGYRVAFESHEWFGQSQGLALWLLKRVDWIITTNSYLKQEFIKHFFEPQRILICPHGVDLNLFGPMVTREQSLTKLGLKDELADRKILLYTGSFKTMNFSKGLEEILRALEILKDPRLYFVAVGGNTGNVLEYQVLAGSLGVANQVKLLEQVDQASLGTWQQAADVLLMPFPDIAHYRYFMAPLKMFEYLAAGRPIIASNLPSIREVLNDSVSFFCEPGDASHLARQISYVFANPDLAESKAKAARNLAKSFSWPVRAEKIINFLKNGR